MKTKLLVIGLFLLGGITGCASIGNQARIVPATDANWKHAPENYNRDNMVEYDCGSLKVQVWEVFIRSKTYFAGPILPVFPVFSTLDESKRAPYLDIEIGTTGPDLTCDFVSTVSITDDQNQTHSSIHCEALHGPRNGSHRVGFNILRDSATQFKLVFPRPLNNCPISPLSFIKSDKTGLRFWKPGP